MLLRQLLYRTELPILPIIASHWLHLKTKPNYEELIRLLCVKMLDPVTQKAFLNSPDGRELIPALNRLIFQEGIEPVESFEEAAGPFRVSGTDKILREKRWQNPVSDTEKLWFRGLIFRENRIIADAVRECYILPDDLKQVLSKLIPGETISKSQSYETITVRPAIPSETKYVTPLNHTFPDFFTLSAALLRDGRELDFPGADLSEIFLNFTRILAKNSFFQESESEADVESIRKFLVQNRTAARIQLIKVWRNSDSYNELYESGELNIASSQNYDKKLPRETILHFIKELQPDVWWSINGFLESVKKSELLFLRKCFRENVGQIFDKNGNDLNGIGSWYQLEGAYIRFLLLGPLQWLGLVQVAFSDKLHDEASAFRINRDTVFLMSESEEEFTSDSIQSKPNLETAVPVVSGDGAISCSTNVPRYFRYMAARFCEVDSFKGDTLILRITPASLTRAENNGLSRSSFLSLLKRFTGNRLPNTLERMLEPSEQKVLPATIYTATILTIPNEAVFSELLDTPRLEKWILQQINQTSILIDPKGIGEIRRFLMEREVFVDIQV